MDTGSASGPGGLPPPAGLPAQAAILQKRFQQLLDTTAPYTIPRWTFTGVSLVLYCLRVFIAQGWYIVTYALGIYLLNLFLAFLTPKFDPASDDLLDNSSGSPGADEGPSLLPTKGNDEFRPFIRRLPEMKFWVSATRAIWISLFCAFFRAFDVPVFWPILLMYFIILFTITMRRQIRHMIKHKYVPWNLGKKRYGGKSDSK
ncbi:RER1-like protein [Fimicolochytrium jonesii]|uniref:RER1-like protein n=1 Tax=Fimicolochytrium jonesii TaxID=1396493 RepID=UPI0022FE2B51|nr:RER1-like protein [Fimicolochytrium jonesii]KAI8820486.1 RER1-like protein [Fimicolochytrium jonesii]